MKNKRLSTPSLPRHTSRGGLREKPEVKGTLDPKLVTIWGDGTALIEEVNHSGGALRFTAVSCFPADSLLHIAVEDVIFLILAPAAMPTYCLLPSPTYPSHYGLTLSETINPNKHFLLSCPDILSQQQKCNYWRKHLIL